MDTKTCGPAPRDLLNQNRRAYRRAIWFALPHGLSRSKHRAVPAAGINEDPVTGSAHCILYPYWSSRLGKSKMVGHQASPRGGVVQVELRGERVMLGGEGVIFARGYLAAV